MKKLFFFFAMAAMMLGMASCENGGNEPSQKAFALRLVRQGDIVAEVSVTPANMQALYIIGHVTKEQVWKDEYLASYLEEFRLAGHTYQELVDNNEIKSGIRYIEDTNLEPGKEYLFYACQVDEELKIVNLELEHVKTLPAGQLSGEFQIDLERHKVRFAKGNLRKKLVGGTYYFAENQWDVLGDANLSETSEYWDLLPWGLDVTNSYYTDFGTMPIINGGNEANQWRTLTADEWEYIKQHAQVGYGQVAGVEGMILVPQNVNNVDIEKKDNVFTAEEWWELEVLGAVFLPISGYKLGNIKSLKETDEGFYWSSTLNKYNDSEDHSDWYMVFLNFDHGIDWKGYIEDRSFHWKDNYVWGTIAYHCSVRLVQDVK